MLEPLNTNQNYFSRNLAGGTQSSHWQQQNQVGQSHSAPAMVSQAASIQNPSGKAALEQKMANCNFQVVDPSQSGAPTVDPTTMNFKFSMKVDGTSCPILFDMDSSFNVSGSAGGAGNLNAVFALLYRAVTDDAKTAIDVQEYNMKIDLKGDSSGLAGTGSGYVISKTDGKVTLGFSATGTGDQRTSNAALVLVLTYPDGLRVELKEAIATVEGKSQSTYFINGKQVDAKAFNGYREKILPKFLASQGDSEEQGPSTGTSVPSQPPVNTQPHQGGGSSSSYSDSYHFQINGCDTGMQTFIGATDTEVQSRICAALQSDSVNNNCAIDERKQMFTYKCPGQVFHQSF